MDIWSLSISGLSLVVAGVGTALAHRRAVASERLAREALEDARRANVQLVWAAAIEAAHRLVAVDPINQDVRDEWLGLRIKLTDLIDELDDWPALRGWLDIERGLGLVLSPDPPTAGGGVSVA